MYDAMGVRRHAGLQAEVLNIVAESVLEGHPKAEQKLKEVLGHTPRQVGAGAACPCPGRQLHVLERDARSRRPAASLLEPRQRGAGCCLQSDNRVFPFSSCAAGGCGVAAGRARGPVLPSVLRQLAAAPLLRRLCSDRGMPTSAGLLPRVHLDRHTALPCSPHLSSLFAAAPPWG